MEYIFRDYENQFSSLVSEFENDLIEYNNIDDNKKDKLLEELDNKLTQLSEIIMNMELDMIPSNSSNIKKIMDEKIKVFKNNMDILVEKYNYVKSPKNNMIENILLVNNIDNYNDNIINNQQVIVMTRNYAFGRRILIKVLVSILFLAGLIFGSSMLFIVLYFSLSTFNYKL
jgi:hypothetical protein